MKHITIISGKQGTGKTKKALELTQDFYYRILPFEYTMLADLYKEPAQTIIFDEFVKERDLETLQDLFNWETYTYKNKASNITQENYFPNIIICTQNQFTLPKSQKYSVEYINL